MQALGGGRYDTSSLLARIERYIKSNIHKKRDNNCRVFLHALCVIIQRF